MLKKIIFTMTLVILSILLFTSGNVLAHHSDAHVSIEVNENQSLDLANHSKSAILIERDTGNILFDKNAEEKLPPASMTKIMTLLLIMEALEKGQLSLDETIRVSEKAASMGGSQIFLEAGEEMLAEDILKGIAVASGNDASVAMAERIAGSEQAFVEMMNNKVDQLGLKSTKFQNATGLPAEDHYSTAHDMAIMAQALLKYEDITKYTSIYEDYLRKGKDNEFWLVNTNKLVRFYEGGVDGLKTGYTREAKYCLTATAEKNGMRTIAVVLGGANSTKERNSDVSQLLDYAFSKYETKQLYEKNQTVTSFEWLKADKQKVDVVTSDSVSVLFEKGTDLSKIDTKITINQNIDLPLEKGTMVGKLQVLDDDKLISETDLVVHDDINHANVFQLFKRTFQSFF
ncbi:D-alanyl-D-alanine carboxypeptidase [Gracilibacillus boraciitolerans JCM 21714]|uniref:serine-type D-Ala-D-Ala carboxypeptidase n=1 Tax=Gracilibacillus boraciitolerans JCM 21714 TaxID=1298598 RepID=W4VDN8_9BACI|nr:D-alanyl-D-alanine carboxypeptidase family protein [Gracilibacillus boraciitolerans]GAE91301.1 D-alanyl-D-alanine carboxypeptidase [Gracilibacillus boraciitolerans JCM 21714]